MNAEKKAASSNVNQIYETVRQMASRFELKPDERINESTLAKSLGVSRTPLREALNRLTAEGLISFKIGKGFFCRSLSPKQIMDLYELRLVIECEVVRLACERATEEQVNELLEFVSQRTPKYEDTDEMQHIDMDEEFHIRIAKMSGNPQFVRSLDNINSQIHFVRWIDMKSRFTKSYYTDHPEIAKAIADRDVDHAVQAMKEHVSRRSDEITSVVREGFAQLYV